MPAALGKDRGSLELLLHGSLLMVLLGVQPPMPTSGGGAVSHVPSSFMSTGCGRQKPQSLLYSPSFLVPPFLFYYFSFGERVLYCNPGWPVAYSIHGHSSASASVCSDGRCEPLYLTLPLLRHIS